MTQSKAWALLVGFLAAGCTSASYVDTSQNILVQTPGADGATCVLRNPNGEWEIKSTPGIVVVERNAGILYVRCLKSGFTSAATTIDALPRGMPWQNILSGGFFGDRAKSASDTAYEYPSLVSLPLAPSKRAASNLKPPVKIPSETLPPAPKEIAEDTIFNDTQAPLTVSEPFFPAPREGVPALAPVNAAPNPPRAMPVVRAPSPLKTTPKRQPPMITSELLGLRMGKHDNFVRIVLDLNKKSTYSTGFDRLGRVVIRLPNARAKADATPISSDYSPITSLVTTSPAEGGGTELAIKTQAPVSIKAFDLDPDREGGHRIVVDLILAPTAKDP